MPDDSSLQNYKPNVMSRIHASNGDLVKEFSKEYRIFIPIKDIPDDLKNAFISAEDKIFTDITELTQLNHACFGQKYYQSF